MHVHTLSSAFAASGWSIELILLRCALSLRHYELLPGFHMSCSSCDPPLLPTQMFLSACDQYVSIGVGLFRYYLVYTAIGAGALLLYGNSSLEACTLPSRFSRWAPIHLRWRWTFSLALLSTSKAATYCVLSRASRCIVPCSICVLWLLA